MCSFIKIATFADKYDLTIDNVYVQKSKVSPLAFRKSARDRTQVDETHFLRRKNFKKKVWLESHDMYYFLARHLTDVDISRLLVSVDPSVNVTTWNIFLNRTLFMTDESSIMHMKVYGLSWKFYRYARWLVRAIFKKAGVRVENRDIKVLLDK